MFLVYIWHVNEHLRKWRKEDSVRTTMKERGYYFGCKNVFLDNDWMSMLEWKQRSLQGFRWFTRNSLVKTKNKLVA